MSFKAAGGAMLAVLMLTSCTPGVGPTSASPTSATPTSAGPTGGGEAPEVSTFVDVGTTFDVGHPTKLYIDGKGCIRGVVKADERSPAGDYPVVFPVGTTATSAEVTLPNGASFRFGADHSSGGALLPLATSREKTGAKIAPGCDGDGDFWFLVGKGSY
jgi:hypothetical protein